MSQEFDSQNMSRILDKKKDERQKKRWNSALYISSIISKASTPEILQGILFVILYQFRQEKPVDFGILLEFFKNSAAVCFSDKVPTKKVDEYVPDKDSHYCPLFYVFGIFQTCFRRIICLQITLENEFCYRLLLWQNS